VLDRRLRTHVALAAACLICSAASQAEEPLVPGAPTATSSAIPESEEGWQILEKGPVRIRAKARPGAQLPEMWVTATTSASVATVQEVLLDFTRFPQFMPYIVEARFVGEADKDGSRHVYARINPPVVTPRDYVARGWSDRLVNPDGSGEFRTHWVAAEGILPPQRGIVRLPKNEGVWHVFKGPDGATVIHYRGFVDPGGWIPGWLADLGNRSAVSDEIKAVVSESGRRARDAGASNPR